MIYLDHHATTPCDPRVVHAMLPWFSTRFGNAASLHQLGWEAEEAVETARRQVANLIGAKASEIVFASGATEANNLALTAANWEVVSSRMEHASIIEPLEDQERHRDFTPLWVARRASGRIDVGDIAEQFDRLQYLADDALVTLMAANNETGTIAPLAEIGRLCRDAGALFHTDAAQAAGKIPIDVEAVQVDLLSLSAHKLYGPKGVGALYVREAVRDRLRPLAFGGGQERGLRSGTLPVPLIVGFGAAADLAREALATEPARLLGLRDRLLRLLVSSVPGLLVNGDLDNRLPGNLNVSAPGVDGEALLSALVSPEDGALPLAVSNGSACSSTSTEPSHVLLALGVSRELALASLRFGLGRWTTVAEVDYAAGRVAEMVARLRS